jgi:hypothetical protein
LYHKIGDDASGMGENGMDATVYVLPDGVKRQDSLVADQTGVQSRPGAATASVPAAFCTPIMALPPAPGGVEGFHVVQISLWATCTSIILLVSNMTI